MLTPKASWPWVKTLLHSVYDQPDAKAVHEQHDRVLDALGDWPMARRQLKNLESLAESAVRTS